MMLTEFVENWFCGRQSTRVALDGSGELCYTQLLAQS
jgi:hypothetical protein